MSATNYTQEDMVLLNEIREQHTTVTMEELGQEVMEYYNRESIKKAFPNDPQARLSHCVKMVNGDYRILVPYNPYTVIPIGIGPVRNTKSGKRGEIHVWIQNKQGQDELRSISLSDRNTDKVKQVQMFNVYNNVKLGQFQSGDFSGDHRSNFRDPQPLGMEPLSVFDRLNINRCKIKDVMSNTAKKSGNWTVSTDYRIIRGVVLDHNKGVSAKGNHWAYYKVTDYSFKDDIVTPDGTVVNPVFSIWVNPLWLVYEKGSEIDFIGPIEARNQQVSMTGYCLLPVHSLGRIPEETAPQVQKE